MDQNWSTSDDKKHVIYTISFAVCKNGGISIFGKAKGEHDVFYTSGFWGTLLLVPVSTDWTDKKQVIEWFKQRWVKGKGPNPQIECI